MIAVAAYLALAAPVQSVPVPLPLPMPVAAPLTRSPPLPLSATAHLAALSPAAGEPSEPAAPRSANAAAPVQTAPEALPATAEPTSTALHTPGDPHERFNRRMFARFQKVDRGFLRPVALGYKHVVPRSLRSGIRHFFANLGEPVVFLNFLLQHKVGKAVETLGRFVINSSFGIGGTLDVAKLPTINLPHRPNGFGDTLGFYGVKPGAFLFLPFVGPTTVRDFFGAQVDAAVLPVAIGKPFTLIYFQAPRTVLTTLDQRARSEGDLEALLGGAVDPYATLRSVYLQDRAAEIAALNAKHHGRDDAPRARANDDLDDPLTDPLTGPVAGKTLPSPPSGSPELQDPLADPASAPAPASAAAPAAPARR